MSVDRYTRPCLSSVLLDSVHHRLLHARMNNSWKLFLSISLKFKFLSLNFLKYISHVNVLVGNLCMHAKAHVWKSKDSLQE